MKGEVNFFWAGHRERPNLLTNLTYMKKDSEKIISWKKRKKLIWLAFLVDYL